MGSIRIEGIYSEELLRKVKEKNISNFVFDLRPVSPTFIQLYRLIEILESAHLLGTETIFLRFHYEKDFIIGEIIKNILDAGLPLKRDNLVLEFSSVEEVSFMASFGQPYLAHYHHNHQWKELASDELMKGVVFPYTALAHLHESNGFVPAMAELYKQCGPQMGKWEKILQIDWDSDVFPSIEEFITFSMMSLPVNSKIEKSYRQPDMALFSQLLEMYKPGAN